MRVRPAVYLDILEDLKRYSQIPSAKRFESWVFDEVILSMLLPRPVQQAPICKEV